MKENISDETKDVVCTGNEAIKKSKFSKFVRAIKENYQLYILLIVPILFLIVFHYAPLYGLQIAFKEYSSFKGISGSPWVGMAKFEAFFKSYYFWDLIWNTVSISLLSLAFGAVLPVAFALVLNEVRIKPIKRTAQTISYAPHFISVVVIVSIMYSFSNVDTGLFNKILGVFGIAPQDFMGEAKYFRMMYVLSGLWQTTGWSAIIYISTLSTVDPELIEAADMDGASRFQVIWHIYLPAVTSLFIIMFIMSTGRVLNVGFEKVYLMQNATNLKVSQVLSTYVYNISIGSSVKDFSLATAIGLFNTFVNISLLLLVNAIVRKLKSSSSLF